MLYIYCYYGVMCC